MRNGSNSCSSRNGNVLPEEEPRCSLQISRTCHELIHVFPEKELPKSFSRKTFQSGFSLLLFLRRRLGGLLQEMLRPGGLLQAMLRSAASHEVTPCGRILSEQLETSVAVGP